MVMTLDRLEEISDVCRQIQEIDEQIQAAYNTYRSPQFNSVRQRNGGETSDPVTAALHAIETLDAKKAECLAEWISFEKELCQIPEIDIQAVIRWKYLILNKNGRALSWREVNKRVYGYPDHWFARKRLNDYLKKCERGEDHVSRGKQETAS